MKLISSFISFLIVFSFIANTGAKDSKNKDPKKLVEKMVETVGDYNKLKSLKDVQYTYTNRDNASGKADVSIERYIFDGEMSWAKYTKHEKYVFPDQQGEVIQGYNGKDSWVTLNGKLIDDPQANKLADFIRKTNFYWFAMMQKLLDPGINYTYEGIKNVNGIDYELVRVGFNEGVGDVSDTYLLYINPNTNLVDQFLFSVMDFGVTEPFIMKVEYEEIEGAKLPSARKFTKANWEGEVLEDIWNDEIMTDIKFNNGFNKSDFDKPE